MEKTAAGDDESAVVLISINGKSPMPGENNNVLETDTFQPFQYEENSESSDVKQVKPKTKIPLIIAWVCVGCAVVFAIAAIILLVKYTALAKPDNNSGNQTTTTTIPSVTPSITPTPSIILSSSSLSSTISPSFTSSSTSTTASSTTISKSVLSVSSKTQTPSIVITSTSSIKTSTTDTSSTSSSSSSISSSGTLSVISTQPSVTVISTTPVLSTFDTATSATATPTVISTSTVASSSNTATATVIVTTPPTPVCPSEQFQCRDGSCIDMVYVCDGKPQCAGGDDEPEHCVCTDDQFRCSSGQCVPYRYRCDGVTQCYDKSDEVNCSCTGFECDSGLCLWTNSVKCNGHMDCDDYSDENKCPFRPGYSRCANGVQVAWNKWCDGIDDCFDNTDENDCDGECNPTGERMCGDFKTCIMHKWWCDGHTDCPDGSDEKKCGICSSDEFQCGDYSCIDKVKVCDGVKQCPSGSDEINCVQIYSDLPSTMSGVVMVMSHDQLLPVCSATWHSHIADEICEYLGHGLSVGHRRLVPDMQGGNGYMSIENKNFTLQQNQTVLTRFKQTSTCESQMIISMTCQPKVCGVRQVDILSNFIVGANLPPLGKWPWVVSLALKGKDVCGGVLINNRWVLTAAHCIVLSDADYTTTPHFYEVTMGTISRDRSAADTAQRIGVDKIVTHPNMIRLVTGVTDWDMALLHLKEPVQYGNNVQPVCVPDQAEWFPTKSQCFLAGWGYINTQLVTVNNLRDAKMRLWGDKDCGRNIVAGETSVNTNSTLCAGYYSGIISGCQGDSGGPLMCADTRGHWSVVGVMSSGAQGCNGNTHKANRFARVSSAADWIDGVIQQQR